jgi:hypothetical protein
MGRLSCAPSTRREWLHLSFTAKSQLSFTANPLRFKHSRRSARNRKRSAAGLTGTRSDREISRDLPGGIYLAGFGGIHLTGLT